MTTPKRHPVADLAESPRFMAIGDVGTECERMPSLTKAALVWREQ